MAKECYTKCRWRGGSVGGDLPDLTDLTFLTAPPKNFHIYIYFV